MRKGIAVPAGRTFFIAGGITALLLGGVGTPPSLGRPAPPGATGRARDQFFAGRSYPEAGPAAVSTEFIVPRLTCTSTNTGVGAGAFLYTIASDVHANSKRTVVSAADVQLFCLRDEPAPMAVVELEGRQSYGQSRPHVGDLMRATLIDSSRVFGVTLQDLTEHHAFTLTRSTFSAPATTAAIGEVPLKGVPSLTPGPLYPITDFGSIRFGSGRINGIPLGAAGGKAFNMISSTKVLQIRTYPLSGHGPRRSRQAFSTAWRHS
jgi:hypothetical protein